MKSVISAWSFLLALFALISHAAAFAADDVAAVPDSLKPPAGQTLKVALIGHGVQIYQCQDGAWKLQGPEATLADSVGRVMAKHYAGPTWEGTDGSKVVGEATAHDDGPDPHAIPWLLLRAKSASGTGIFGNITSIQRLQTGGGMAPATVCAGTQTVRVPYSAHYYFYAAS